MRHLIAVLAMLLLAPTSYAAEVCSAYANAGVITVPAGVALAPILVEIPVPEGAIGIDSWKFSAELGRETMIRAALRLRANDKMQDHWVTRKSDQSELFRPGAPIALTPESTVWLRVQMTNESPDTEYIGKGNIWVYFRMGAGY